MQMESATENTKEGDPIKMEEEQKQNATGRTPPSEIIEVDSAEIKALIGRNDGLSNKIENLSGDINGIKADVRLLMELKQDVEDVKKTASDAYDMADSNTNEIQKIKGDPMCANGTIKALQATCVNLCDSITQQETYTR